MVISLYADITCFVLRFLPLNIFLHTSRVEVNEI